jgi:hypothetical protein
MKWEDVLKSVVFPLLAAITGMALATARLTYGDQPVLLAILIILVVILGFSNFYSSKTNSILCNDFLSEHGKLLNRLTLLEQAVSNSGTLNWIYSRGQLMLIEQEKTASCKEIWIVTPDLSTDTGDSPWVATVRDNAEQGIVYRYICEKTEGAEAAASQLANTFRLNQDKCFIAMVDKEVYERFPNHHIVVYDPGNSTGKSESYGELETVQRGYWFKLTTSRHQKVIDRARRILNENSKPIKDFMHD